MTLTYDTIWATYDGNGLWTDTYDGIPLQPGNRLRVDVYNASGTKLNYGGLTNVLAFDYKLELDRIGSFTLDLPADDEKATYLSAGYELRIHRENEGLVFRGYVDRIEAVANGSGYVCRVTGSSIARALTWANTLLARQYSGSTLATVAAALVGLASGWNTGTLGVPATTVLARFDGASAWDALAKVAQLFQYHVREDPLNKEVDVDAFGTSSGITFQNVAQVTPLLANNRALFPIADIARQNEAEELWNSVVMLGGGEGINQLTLRYSNRSSPYTISSAAGPDGQTYYYLEDATSVAAYGRRTKVVVVKEAVPLANSAAGIQAAANALYDVGVTWLQRHKDPQTTYTVTPVGLKHISSGSPICQVGDKVRVVYHGITKDRDGTVRGWLTVDASLWIMAIERSFDAAGSDQWKVTVATTDRQEEDDTAKVAAALNSIEALKVAVKPYTYNEVHVLPRTSLSSAVASYARLNVKWDANVGYLHKSNLTFQIRALRSNVLVTASESAHQHVIGTTLGTTSSTMSADATGPTGSTSVVTALGSPTTTSVVATLTAVTNVQGPNHTHSLNGHTHSISAGAAVLHNHVETGGTTNNNTAGASDVPNAGNANTTVAGGGTSSADNKSLASSTPASTANAVTGYSPTTGNVASTSHTHSHVHSHTLQRYNVAVDNPSPSTGTVDVQASVSGHALWMTTVDGISAHSHALSFGVYVDPSPPGSPAVQVWINSTNRTVALGGPWSTFDTDISLDVTQYLQNATGVTGQPLQQTNTVEFRSGSGAVDVEATLRTLVTATSLVPV